MTIGVVLQTWKRNTLVKQLSALHDQSLGYDQLVVVGNESWSVPGVVAVDKRDSAITCSKNWGVWPRFQVAQWLGTDWIAMFDDDTLPGSRWLEACLRTAEEFGENVYGVNGIAYPCGAMSHRAYFGHTVPVDMLIECDIVGQAWFFPRKLAERINLAPDWQKYPSCGEDYWLSVMAQQAGKKTYCMPWTTWAPEFCGATAGDQTGGDEHALWKREGEEERRNERHEAYRAMGWRTRALSLSAGKGPEGNRDIVVKAAIPRWLQRERENRGMDKADPRVPFNANFRFWPTAGEDVPLVPSRPCLEKTTLLLNTHSKAGDCWSMFFGQLDLHWPDHPPVLVACDNPELFTAHMPGWERNIQKVIGYDSADPFTTQYRDMLRQVETEYVFTMQEDMILLGPVDSKRMRDHVEFLDANKLNGIDCLRLVMTDRDILTGIGDSRFLRRGPTMYSYAMQPSFFRTTTLRTCYERCPPIETIRDAEVGMFDWIQPYCQAVISHVAGFKRGFMHFDNSEFPYTGTAIVKGRWNVSEYPELRELWSQYGINPSLRDVV